MTNILELDSRRNIYCEDFVLTVINGDQGYDLFIKKDKSGEQDSEVMYEILFDDLKSCNYHPYFDKINGHYFYGDQDELLKFLEEIDFSEIQNARKCLLSEFMYYRDDFGFYLHDDFADFFDRRIEGLSKFDTIQKLLEAADEELEDADPGFKTLFFARDLYALYLEVKKQKEDLKVIACDVDEETSISFNLEFTETPEIKSLIDCLNGYGSDVTSYFFSKEPLEIYSEQEDFVYHLKLNDRL